MTAQYRFSLIVLFLLILPSCKQPFQLYYVSSFAFVEQEIEHLPANSLFIFDIDETLFALNPAIDGEESPLNQIFQKVFHGAELDKTDEMLHKIIPLVIEPRVVNIIKRLQRRGIPVIALTACGHGPSGQVKDATEYRIHLLKSIGIHLENSFPDLSTFEFARLAKNNYIPLFYHGVLFSQPSRKKIVLASFLKVMNLHPTLYYFDNSRGYVEEIQEVADQEGIPGAGFIYTGLAQVHPWKIQAYNYKLKHLISRNEWLPDADSQSQPQDTYL